MAVVLVEGFDTYNGTGTNTGLQAKWSGSAGGSMATGRFTGQSFQARNTNSGVGGSAASRLLPSAIGSFTVGFAFRAVTLTSMNGGTNNTFLTLLGSSGTVSQITMYVDNNGTLNVTRAGTVLGSAVGAIIDSTWQYIELSVFISDTVGTVVVKVNGATVINLSGVDTRNGTPTTIDTIQLQASSFTGSVFGGWFYDDLYIVDSTTSLGERRIETLYPTADTAQKDWTPDTGTVDFSRVNEAQVVTTNYVQASTVGNTDRYTMGDLTGTPATIDAVQVVAYAQKTDATTRAIALEVKSGATISDSSDFNLAASYGKFDRLILTDPATSAAWSVSGVNALEAGVKVTI